MKGMSRFLLILAGSLAPRKQTANLPSMPHSGLADSENDRRPRERLEELHLREEFQRENVEVERGENRGSKELNGPEEKHHHLVRSTNSKWSQGGVFSWNQMFLLSSDSSVIWQVTKVSHVSHSICDSDACIFQEAESESRRRHGDDEPYLGS